MIKTFLSRLKKKALARKEKATPDASASSQGPGYTEEEARKVKERLQGLGYID